MNMNRSLKSVVVAGVAVGALYAVYRGAAAWWSGGGRAAPRVMALVMSGPSGVGKGTIIGRLMAEHPGRYAFCVSHTTRALRDGEVAGKSYHFTTTEDMERMLARDEFLEACTVHGNMYGTSKAALRDVCDSGRVPIIEVDVNGAQKIKAHAGSGITCIYVFIGAPSIEELERRIVTRGNDPAAKVAVRLETARGEMAFLGANPDFFHRVLVNEELDETMRSFYSTLSEFGL